MASLPETTDGTQLVFQQTLRRLPGTFLGDIPAAVAAAWDPYGQ